jgi:hypothetical protein
MIGAAMLSVAKCITEEISYSSERSLESEKLVQAESGKSTPSLQVVLGKTLIPDLFFGF